MSSTNFSVNIDVVWLDKFPIKIFIVGFVNASAIFKSPDFTIRHTNSEGFMYAFQHHSVAVKLQAGFGYIADVTMLAHPVLAMLGLANQAHTAGLICK